MWVLKSTGERQEFNADKIKRTAIRAGATPNLAREISENITDKVREGTDTREIMGWILKYMDKHDPLVAARYSLKDSLMSMGPAGFTFELYMQRLLTFKGYQVSIPDILPGACISHEVDLIISQKDQCWMGECKFHNRHGLRSGIKDALYTYARFLDLMEGHLNGVCRIDFNFPWLICNTQFSEDVIQYAACKHMKLLSWKHPSGSSLRDIIEENKFYPITVLRQLDSRAREQALRAGIVTCRDLLDMDKAKLSFVIGLNQSKTNELWQEAWNLTNLKHHER